MRGLCRLFVCGLLALALPVQSLAAAGAWPCKHHAQAAAEAARAPCHEAVDDDEGAAGQAHACSVCKACSAAAALPVAPPSLLAVPAPGDIGAAAPTLRACAASERLERPPRSRLA